MGCVSGFGRIVLVVLNLLFLLVSLALVAVGVTLKFFGHKILQFLAEFSAVKEGTLKSLGIPNLDVVTQLPLLDEIGVALLVFGCVLLAISFCACCGACYELRPLLIVFVILMAVLVLAQAVVGGLFLAKDSALHDGIKKKLGEQIHDEYVDKQDTKDAFSLAINIMNYMLECCGIRSYEDFKDGKPVQSCCTKATMNSSPATCNKPAISSSAFNQEGCYAKLQDKVLDKQTLGAVILGLLLLLQVVEIVFAILIVREASAVGPV